MEERSEVADQMIDAWKANAEKSKAILRESDLDAHKQLLMKIQVFA